MPSIPAYTLEDEAPDEADHHEELNRLDEPALHTAELRRESTRLNATPTRQLSQSGGAVNGTPRIESTRRATPCSNPACLPCHTCTWLNSKKVRKVPQEFDLLREFSHQIPTV